MTPTAATASAALAALDAAGVRVRLHLDGAVRLAADAPPPPELLALARAHRDSIAALLRGRMGHLLPGVPPAWCEGVARLATMPAPGTITPARWAVLAATAARLLRDHGAALHGAGWGVLDVFGLHSAAPMTFPPGWGLAWLLGEHGEVLDVAAELVGMRRQPDGARLACRRRVKLAAAGLVPAWNLPGMTA